MKLETVWKRSEADHVSGAEICPLCAGKVEDALEVGDINRETSDVAYAYGRCQACGTLFLRDVPGDLGPHYPRQYYVLPTLAELDRAARGELEKLAMVRPFVADGALVDVGAAYGVFARAAQLTGYEVTAIEMDARCCDYLRDQVGVRVIESDDVESALKEAGAARVVVMWHVIEHLRDPWRVLQRVASQLEPGGVLALATPNPGSFQFRLLGRRWAHVDAPRHLFLIPFETLSLHMQTLGFRLGSVTSSDRAGRLWNTFGWEYAVRWRPARRRSTRLTQVLAHALALAFAPFERRPMQGTTYTAVFIKR